MADILINQLPAGTPLLTDLLILANPNTGIAKKSTVTQLNTVLTLAKLSDVTQGTPPANSILEFDGSFNYITNVVRANGASVGYVPTFSATSPVELSPSNLKETAYGLEISEDQYINNASVLFGLSSNTKGFVMPKMTSTDRTAISSPLKGLEVFDTTFNIPYFYNGTAWKGVQEVLVSANNIKTINGTTILGSGNLTIASGITTLNTLTASTQTFATSSTGTDFTITSATSTHTFNLPTASASARGLLSSANWTTFNNKIDGSGTTNYLSKFTASGTIGNSLIYDDGTNLGINGNVLIGKNTKAGLGRTIELYNDGDVQFRIQNNITGSGSADGAILFVDSIGRFGVYNYENTDLLFGTNNSIKATLYANGNFQVGTGTDNGNKLQVNGNGLFNSDLYVKKPNNNTCYIYLGDSTNTYSLLEFRNSSNFYTIGTVSGGNFNFQNGFNNAPVFSLYPDATATLSIGVGNKANFSGKVGIGGYSNIYTIPNMLTVIGNTSIGSTEALSTENSASVLVSINSLTQGFLMPRMTTTQINAITSPATGLEVYNTTLAQPCFYDGSGWRRVSHTNM
jgi:hypothetical protein